MNKPVGQMSIKKEETPEQKAKTDLELVRRCQKGDEAAFVKLIERYQKKVFSIALSMVKDPEDAMDIAQDAFIKINRYISNFQGSSSFYTWLYRIVVNMCIDHLRRKNKHMSVEFDERFNHKEAITGATPTMGGPGEVNPARNLGRKELAAHIQKALDALPPYHRTVIIMRELEGLSYSEMAKTMGVSKGTIMSRLHHARQKLQRALGDYLEGDLTVK